MINLEKLVYNKLESKPNRIKHTQGVIKVSVELAKLYQVSEEDAKLAALFHDYMKYDLLEEQTKHLSKDLISRYKDVEFVYHAYSAAEELKRLKPDTKEDVLNAIRYHIWGRPNMSTLEKIILVADKCEPSRTFDDAKIIYSKALKDLDEAVYYTLESSIKHLKLQGIKPHNEQVKTYIYYKRKDKKND